MKAQELLTRIEAMGINVIAGVPDSTLKQFCDGLQTYQGNFKHYVTANEGAAVGLAVGSFLDGSLTAADAPTCDHHDHEDGEGCGCHCGGHCCH